MQKHVENLKLSGKPIPKEISKTNVFTDKIFLGNGEQSEYFCYILRAKLEHMISLSSGYQQLGCGPNSYSKDDYKKETEKINKEIKNILKEFSVALGVKDI